MEPLSYDDDPLMREIRNDRIRQLAEGTSDSPDALQIELGPSTPSSNPASGENREDEYDAGGSGTKDREHLPVANKGGRRVRRADAKNDKDSKRVDTGDRPTNDKVRSYKRKRIDDAKEKPSGIEAKPNSREKAARKEAPPSEKAGILNAWGLGRNKSKDKAEKPKKEPLRSRPFSEAEAEAIKEPLLAALLDYFKYADDFIYATNKKHEQIAIWSSIDYEDAEFLVDVWLRRARTSAKAASHVTAVVNKHEELRVAAIALPRAYQTFMVYFQNGIGVR